MLNDGSIYCFHWKYIHNLEGKKKDIFIVSRRKQKTKRRNEREQGKLKLAMGKACEEIARLLNAHQNCCH